jgi:hypothetical protein
MTVAEIAAALAANGLRPVIDPVLSLVRADCPDCRAGDADSLRLWRPLVVIPADSQLIIRCDGCGQEVQ